MFAGAANHVLTTCQNRVLKGSKIMPLQVLEACSGDAFDYELTDEDLDNDFGEELGRRRPR